MYETASATRTTAEVAEERRHAAARHGDGDAREPGRVGDDAVDEREVELVVALGQSGREHLVVLLDRGEHVGDGQLPRGEGLEVEVNLELPLAAALDLHLRHAGDADELRA